MTSKNIKNYLKIHNQLEIIFFSEFKYVFLSHFQDKKIYNLNFSHYMKLIHTKLYCFSVQNHH